MQSDVQCCHVLSGTFAKMHTNSEQTVTLHDCQAAHKVHVPQYPSVRVSLYTIVTRVCVHYMYCHYIITPLSEYPGSMCTLHVLPLHHYPSVRVSLYTPAVCVHVHMCTATAPLSLCQSVPVYHSNSGSTCTLLIYHYSSVRVSLYTTVTSAVRIHYMKEG